MFVALIFLPYSQGPHQTITRGMWSRQLTAGFSSRYYCCPYILWSLKGRVAHKLFLRSQFRSSYSLALPAEAFFPPLRVKFSSVSVVVQSLWPPLLIVRIEYCNDFHHCMLSLGNILIKRDGRSDHMMKQLKKFLEVLSACIISSQLVLFLRAKIGPDTDKTTD